MISTFNADSRAEFFNKSFPQTQLDLLRKGEIPHLHVIDQLILRVLDGQPSGIRIFDYGCGQGRLLGELLGHGYDAYGYEPSRGMAEIATQIFVPKGEDHIFISWDDVLQRLSDEKFDFVLLTSVTQYLSDDERMEVFRRCRAILRPTGKLVATFQNALFDMFTFNKYTVHCFINMLLDGHLSASEAVAVRTALEGLLTNPTAPEYSPTRARDNIYMRSNNPLTARDDLKEFGFELQSLLFCEWFGLPPLLMNKLGAVGNRVKERFELVHANDWRGHFMANHFLVTAVPC